MFRYSIKYLNHCINNTRMGLEQHMYMLEKGLKNDESYHKVQLYFETDQEKTKRFKKSIGKDKYAKKETRRSMLK
jgi:hypothetical protein